jgi:sulfhydrogenase subunit alpha
MKSAVPHYIAKIEGHGSLRIDYTTDSAKMQIHEGERLFEAMLVGRNYQDGVFIPQRICGVCPTAHCISAIKAIEYAMGVEISKTTRDLRKLMICGQTIQSHALHLFFLVLPDYLNVESALALAHSSPEKFKMALNLKKIGDKIVEVIGGRAVHPITPEVGGFSKVPSQKDLMGLRRDLEMMLHDATDCVRLFASLEYPELENPTQYHSIQADNKYGFYGGAINSSSGEIFDIKDYRRHIDEYITPYSTAKFAKSKKKPMMVGSISRLNLHSMFLNPLAEEELEKSGINFPTYNSFHNNFAQSVEILHFIEEAISRIDDILSEGMADFHQEIRISPGFGSGAVEAPRGTLYYSFGIDEAGKITECNIITPTVQNLPNIESDAQELLSITDGKPKAKREHLLEMLVRAYDPCITCSVH